MGDLTVATLGGLVVLALVDSTSFGTIGVPLWMLVQRKVRVGGVLVYLATISVFYWLLGAAILLGASALASSMSGIADSRAFLWGQLSVGVALFAASFAFDRKRTERRRQRRAARQAHTDRPSRNERMKDRVVGERASLGAIVVVALVAGVIEAASMLPYLGAIGLLAASGASQGAQLLVLVAYVVVMIAPALILLAVRLTLRRFVEPLLERANDWMERNSGEMLSWVLGILGVLLALDAVSRLGLV